METSDTFRVRFRFWLQKKLNVAESEKDLTVAGRQVVLSSQVSGKSIKDSDWLVMNARGFESQQDASAYAQKLKAATEVSSVRTRLGINAGTDVPTSGFGKSVSEILKSEHNVIVRGNVHGIDIFPDDPRIAIMGFSGTGTVHAQPDPFLSDIDELFSVADGVSSRARDIVLLMNHALTRADPVAGIVFSVSAVEMLGQDEKWSDAQSHLLIELASAAEQSAVGSQHERNEVADAIRRGVQKLSLRQGVLRLLASLELGHLKRQWDALYSERSTLVHGLAPNPGVDYGDLAHRTINMCGHILLKAVAREIPGADKHIGTYYPV